MSKLCKRILLILAVFSSFLTLFACSAIQIDTYHVELPQDKYQLRVGQEIEALPIVSKNGQECDLEVSYHSYDASIATYVDGKIVALKSGEVRIKVTLKNNSKVYATALVTVVNDDSLIVAFNYEKTMIKGTTQLLTYELLVEKNRKLTFTSSDENVATIDELGNIKAITVGTTTIETVVSSLYDEGVSKTYKLVIEVKDLTFAINYVLDGGTNSENNPNEYVPEKLPLLLENPNKSGYKFVGWYDNENFTGESITEISAGTMGDVTLYAKWNALDYRISYELNGGTNAENPDGYDVSDLPVSLHAPSRTGYIFKGWYMGENRVLAIPVGTTGNVVVSAKWEPITYTIDFDTNGGLPTLSSIDYTIESDSFTLQEITKVGYTFDGWYNGETKVTEITTGTYGNMTLVAKWTADLYTISYDLADGVNNPENPTSYTIESGLITLKDPTKEGYTFAGWFNGEQLITTIDSNTLENISLTAKWTVNSYKLTFDVDGNLTEKTFKYGESITAIENPTKVGHTFVGWSEELPETMPANDITVEAKWEINSYDITYDLAGGVNNSENPTTYTIESGLITLKNPTREGYTFLGWYNGEQLVTIIDSNTLENISLTAKWKITTDHEGTEDDPYSVDDALKIAGTLSSGEYTELVYITGVVTDAGTFDTYYRNVYICDKNSKETILVYSCNISEIVDVIYVNDTVVVKGYITNYRGNTMEISSKGNSYATFVSKEAGLSTITVSETSSEFAIINELSTMEGLNGSSFTFKVSVTEGYEIVCVKVNGVEITPNNDVYTATISGNTIISVETKVKGAKDPETIVSLTFPDDNSSNNGIGSYTDEWTAKIGTYEWTITGFNNNNWNSSWTYIKAGKKSTAGVAKITSKFAEIITSITITVDSIKTTYINSIKLIISENADGSNALEEISLDLKKGTNEIKISKTTKNCYYILTFDINSKTSKNGTAMQISKVEYVGYKADSSDLSKTHNISYVNLPEGATNSNPTSYTEGETITLVDPVLPGYTFEGWYDNAECTGTKITEISGYTTDITLYAKFAKIPTHSISYKYNVDSTDITNDNPTEYAEGDSTILKNAALPNYIFDGWYLDSEHSKKITAIDPSWTADVVIYGKFILDTLKETVVATTTFSANTNSGKVNDYTTTWSVTCDKVTWTMKNFNNYNNGWDYVKAGSKKNASIAEIITDSTMVDAITKVVVTVDKVTASSVNSFKLIVASDANFEKVIETVSLNIKAGENTFSCTTPMAKCYYKIVIDCKKASSNGIVQISKLEYYTKK